MPIFMRFRTTSNQLQQAFLTAPPETTGVPRRLSPLVPADGEESGSPTSPGNRVARVAASPADDLMDTLSRRLERIMSLGSTAASSVHSPRSSFGGRERRRNSASARPGAVSSTPRGSTRWNTHGGESGRNSIAQVLWDEQALERQAERQAELQAERRAEFQAEPARALPCHGPGALPADLLPAFCCAGASAPQQNGLGHIDLGVVNSLADFLPTPGRSASKNLPPLDDQTVQNSYAVATQLQPRPIGGSIAPGGSQIHICNSALAYFNGSLPSSASVGSHPPSIAPVPRDDGRARTRARSWRLPPLAAQQNQKQQKQREKFMTHTGIFPSEPQETPPLLQRSQPHD